MNKTLENVMTRSCWQVFITSMIVLMVFPSYFTPCLWLCISSVLMLLVIYRYRLAAAWSAILVRRPPSSRRWRSLPIQARRKGFGKTHVRQNPMRAA
jgi:hypothetical protein